MHAVDAAQLRGSQEPFFEDPRQPTLRRPLPFSPPHVAFSPKSARRFAHPTHLSRIPAGTDIGTAVYGAGLLGMPLFRQGEEVAALLCAQDAAGSRLYPEVVIVKPRRSSKSTATWSEIIGRCATRPGTRVLFTAQDGTRAREIMLDEVMESLRANGFELAGIGTFRIANGSEAIRFANGSLIRVVPPKPAIFRSKAADVIYLDELGEYDPGLAEELLAAALPLMDTREDPQLIMSGTPSPARAGLLWDKLQEGIDPKKKRVGVLAYMIRDGESSTRLDKNGEEILNRSVLLRVHPGIGTLTTYARIRNRFENMTRRKFEMEYLCRFPEDPDSAAIASETWRGCSAGGVLPARPERVGIGYDVEPDGSAAALCLAWRDDAGRPHVELVAFDPGTDWLPARAQAAHKKYRAAVAYDQIGANTDPAERLNRLRVRLDGLALKAIQGAAARLVDEIARGRLRHYDQPDLDAAVSGLTWRNVGDAGRLFGRRSSSSPVSPMVAASVALWSYDKTHRSRTTTAGFTVQETKP